MKYIISKVSSQIKTFLLQTVFITSVFSAYSQVSKAHLIANSKFPNSWDINRDLRSRNGQILAWVQIKEANKYQTKSCITVVFGPDTLGNIEYFISHKYTQKPFTEWRHVSEYKAEVFTDSDTGFKFGLWDVHLEVFTHKPTKTELYLLLKNWRFKFFKNGSNTLSAGIDEKLWLNIFGFTPDKNILL